MKRYEFKIEIAVGEPDDPIIFCKEDDVLVMVGDNEVAVKDHVGKAYIGPGVSGCLKRLLEYKGIEL